MTQSVRTAIFPVAGLGTRFLPATKATPKELLPVIDTPLIQYAIDEARAAGIERMVFVTHPSKPAIERHVMDDKALRAELQARGKDGLAEDLAESAFCPVADDVRFVMQPEPLGLGHAVLCARDEVLPGPVAVILPDDLILGTPGALSEMIAAHEGGHMVATMTVPREETAKYGILAVTEQDGPIMKARGMVEKPAPATAPSREAVVGRYVLDASIFADLETQAPGAGGEIQLTDAISRGAARLGLRGFRFSGQRFDCGSKAGMLAATLHLASQDPDYADVFAEFGLTAEPSRAA
ncbi:UTP--glucose-1-phosphate uridylyltransferase [Ponticoccus sp. SC2-23]|uniref:UTP--glucose-1-phosphate uridylyltransferase n=1 Tax=Alexandriicola marinus TaxID=2081710 RepID=UPI000FD8B894|nr:UTP--glucose-1-phosphate uridylyltransferase [Alexandriicola marinus]MBM1219196.1 UTP--glucose-1-phosphate uridylyltransferase [Ponticoccus sp. SC6-9]MBM1223732.1 UTP--glucose-1-phosphate uridylyltransferase [Ponticoccus sp. SC6-15]MBM1229009.1 UTP--glucose-1-phosphate uridylyltransferase [Ponticoccus sp. SC6-38]MBM1232698.1 UTP--glucose-1-phosphate uridylyltransferase [Ponticoccus sp. SC6-45]MBM1237352.1 UTP--glucose-1-phosphate uridylyltransferase [Ponticoccus sp. SC6-49]MBM1241709.1 UTP